MTAVALALSPEALSFTPDREFRLIEPAHVPFEPPEVGHVPVKYGLLDHGHVHVKDRWGSDEAIIETARMSTDKGFLGWEPGECPVCKGKGKVASLYGPFDNPLALLSSPLIDCRACEGRGRIPGDAKLLRYLYEKKHSTPFEFAGLTIEVQAPLMVFREWHRHRTQSYSEMSARYVQMPDLHYVPSVARIIASSRASRNRQAGGAGAIEIPGIVGQSEEEQAQRIQELIRSEQARIYSLYEELISFGVAKEVARIDTPVSRYSRMRATANLRNWLGFLTLRMDPNAQFEIRQYAWCVADAIAVHFPRTYELFLEGMLPMLEPELAPKRLFRDALEALSWAGGSNDFQAGGAAEEGWGRMVAPVLARLRRALGKAA